MRTEVKGTNLKKTSSSRMKGLVKSKAVPTVVSRTTPAKTIAGSALSNFVRGSVQQERDSRVQLLAEREQWSRKFKF